MMVLVLEGDAQARHRIFTWLLEEIDSLNPCRINRYIIIDDAVE